MHPTQLAYFLEMIFKFNYSFDCSFKYYKKNFYKGDVLNLKGC